MNLTSQSVEESFDADRDASGMRFAIVAARFNGPIVERLVSGAIDCLKRHGAEFWKLVWVPGSFELPLVAKKLAESKQYAAVICLGAIIRGDTAHFDHVATQAASGILQASLSTDVPVIFSVLTTENVAQAEARSKIMERSVNLDDAFDAKCKKSSYTGNSGYSGALAAIEMAHVMEQVSREELCDLKG